MVNNMLVELIGEKFDGQVIELPDETRELILFNEQNLDVSSFKYIQSKNDKNKFVFEKEIT